MSRSTRKTPKERDSERGSATRDKREKAKDNKSLLPSKSKRNPEIVRASKKELKRERKRKTDDKRGPKIARLR